MTYVTKNNLVSRQQGTKGFTCGWTLGTKSKTIYTEKPFYDWCSFVHDLGYQIFLLLSMINWKTLSAMVL